MQASRKDEAWTIIAHLEPEALEDLRLSIADRIAHKEYWAEGEYETHVAILNAIMRENKRRTSGE